MRRAILVFSANKPNSGKTLLAAISYRTIERQLAELRSRKGPRK